MMYHLPRGEPQRGIPKFDVEAKVSAAGGNSTRPRPFIELRKALELDEVSLMHSANQIWVEIKVGDAGRSGATAKLHAAEIGANLFGPSGSRPAAATLFETLPDALHRAAVSFAWIGSPDRRTECVNLASSSSKPSIAAGRSR